MDQKAIERLNKAIDALRQNKYTDFNKAARAYCVPAKILESKFIQNGFQIGELETMEIDPLIQTPPKQKKKKQNYHERELKPFKMRRLEAQEPSAILTCRLCLINTRNTIDLFKFPSVVTEIERILQESLDNEAEKPNSLCLACFEKITDFTHFQIVITENQEKLRTMTGESEAQLVEALDEATNEVFFEEVVTDQQQPEEEGSSGEEEPQIVASPPFFCSTCLKYFSKEARFVDHVKKLHAEKPQLQCDACSKRFFTEERLEAHRRRRHRPVKPQSTSVKCQYCPLSFVTPEELVEHRKVTHKTVRKVPCLVCGYRACAKFDLYSHLATHGIGDGQFMCRYCKRVFRRNETKYNHERKVHPQEWRRDSNARKANQEEKTTRRKRSNIASDDHDDEETFDLDSFC